LVSGFRTRRRRLNRATRFSPVGVRTRELACLRLTGSDTKPTYSALYEDQAFLDAFSSLDLVNWTKHGRVFDTDKTLVERRREVWSPKSTLSEMEL
jgi:hypothetical protein